jgi:hypothetical protein
MIRHGLSFASTIAALVLSSSAMACGGFFCQLTPVVQAGEQIVFSQSGNDISALVRIFYQGDAEDFSWVVPVPASLELDGGVDVGSDLTFTELDAATQPQFVLEQQGEACPSPVFGGGTTGGVSESVADSASGGVSVEETTVGPFDVQLITSENPDAMANWLVDNNYDLSDRGRELIEPYVLDGMKFVGLKLRSGQSAGSIQPVILRYQSEKPMIPIRLTAVAAQDDMGVLVWIAGPSRAVPDNYLHVVPNYTRLNWYTGTRNAYASYQTLVTDAMDEAGGQGFATDMAGQIDDELLSRLTNADNLQAQLESLDRTTTDAGFIAGLANLAPSAAFQDELQRALPLPSGEGTFIYFDAGRLAQVFNEETLAGARNTLRESFQRIEIDPLNASAVLLPQGSYLTRLYTTLSADEMTVDPTFVYNSQMGDQSRERRATLSAFCGDNGTEWTLTLGAGTGRDGEVVIDATSDIPIGPVPVEVQLQDAAFTVARTTASALPDVTSQNTFNVVEINGGSSGSVTGVGTGSGTTGTGTTGSSTASVSSGGGSAGFGLLFGGVLAGWLRRRRSCQPGFG